MVTDIKLSMRINHNALDNDIQSNIDTCIMDLKRVGIVEPDEEDNLIRKACELYCKWQYDYLGKAERYQKAYENLRDSLSLCSDYNTEAEESEGNV